MNNQLALRFDAYGPPSTLAIHRDLPMPTPGPGEVRVRVEASSVQFTDTLIRRGIYPDVREAPPHVPGYDLVGVVDAIGPGVSDFAVGDRVGDLTVLGANQRYAIRPANGLVAVPDGVDAAEATALILSWMTAQQALFRVGKLKAGERLLVLGGNGAVGLASIALAVAAGVEVYASASERHHERVRALGAEPVARDGWGPTMAELGGVDVVLDGICNDQFRPSYRALRRGGRLVVIGASGPASRGRKLEAVLGFLRVLAWWPLLPDGKHSHFYSITKYRAKHPDHWREDLSHLFALLGAGTIAPDVAERIAPSDVADAHARLEAGGLLGKIVLDPWG